MSRIRPVPQTEARTTQPSTDGAAQSQVDLLTERQRTYLRLVLQFKNSKEIAALTGTTSYRAVDKQLLKANAILGVSTRFEAAQLFAAWEKGVEPLHPANALPSPPPNFRFSPPWPTARAAVNTLSWRQVAVWTAIIAIVTPLGLTAAGMAYVTLLFLLRLLEL
ncbi:RNA polymerase subunit sigma-70 [Sphingobium yanoikuyae]|uniref:RNA polymerase subunit sigma-70 n=1 Tax=Sphingobium yanoikuyae TaxID=13690 RepID=UPI001F315391|nr:RNA polymerase subunit sigma-70 [Sphingobium yanoikuyae]